MQIETIRGWQFTKMEQNLKAIESILETADKKMLDQYRDGGTGWTVLEVLGHLLDFERLFPERARLTVEQENAPLPFPNPDELVSQNKYNEQNWQRLLEGRRAARDKHLEFLKARAEADWKRPAQHPTRGPFTLHDQLFLTTLHDSIHIEQITRILAEKRSE